ncbi:MAG: hypothetical protein QM640_07280 [Niabella sp.]
MKQARMKTSIATLTGLLLFALFVNSGCTKTEDRWTDVVADDVTVVDSSTLAARIESFKVVSPGEDQAIYSAVNDSAKTITTYLPAYYEYYYMEVEIDLPDGATVSPSADELVPVFPDELWTYTVTAADGSTTTYTHKTVIQQAGLILDEISTASSTITVSNDQSAIVVTGANFLPDYEVTRLYVVDSLGNKLMELKAGTAIGTYTATYSFVSGSGAVSAGTNYWLRMECYNETATMQHPFRFVSIL